MKTIVLFLLVLPFLSCTKVYRTSAPVQTKVYKQTFAASPNSIYYALRWVLKTYGYPIAEEDLQNGVIKTRYVPIRSTSHYVAIFDRKDFGANGAYHQLEVRLSPKNGKTDVAVASRVQAVVSPIQSRGVEEALILEKIGDYLRDPTVQVTNLGIQE